MKKIVQRTCIGCGKKTEKTDLIRIVKHKTGSISIDKTGKSEGRGAYICGDKECLEKIIKTNKLGRTFECEIPEEIYEELRGANIE